MHRPYKLIHRLSNVLFVPTVMLILAVVVKCSQPLHHSVHEPLTVDASDADWLHPLEADPKGNNELPKTMNR